MISWEKLGTREHQLDIFQISAQVGCPTLMKKVLECHRTEDVIDQGLVFLLYCSQKAIREPETKDRRIG
jgi:hypothetical protein